MNSNAPFQLVWPSNGSTAKNASPSTPGDNTVNTAIFKFFLTYSRQNNQSKNQWDASKSFVQNCLAMLHPNAGIMDQGQGKSVQDAMDFNPGCVSTATSSTQPILTMNDLQLLPMDTTATVARRKHRRSSITRSKPSKHLQVPNGMGVPICERDKWDRLANDASRSNSSSNASSIHETPINNNVSSNDDFSFEEQSMDDSVFWNDMDFFSHSN